MKTLQRTESAMLERHDHVFGRLFGAGTLFWLIWIALTACQPRVALEAPKEPIVINLNVKIEHEVRVKVDRELEDVFEQNPELFGQ